jgi:hypothetical protein
VFGRFDHDTLRTRPSLAFKRVAKPDPESVRIEIAFHLTVMREGNRACFLRHDYRYRIRFFGDTDCRSVPGPEFLAQPGLDSQR